MPNPVPSGARASCRTTRSDSLLADRQTRAAGFTDRLPAAPERLDPPRMASTGRLHMMLEPAAAVSEHVSELVSAGHMLVVAGSAFPPTRSPAFESATYRVPHLDGIIAAVTAVWS